MAESKRLSFDQYKQSDFNVSDMLRQKQLQARLASNDQALVRNSWKDFGQAFTDRSNKDSASKRAGAISNLYRQARQDAKNVKNSGLGDQAVAIAAAPIQQATSKMLQQSWLNLIDSWGATLIWINVHWFMNITMGDKFFCDLGKEWLPKAGAEAKGGGGEAMESILGLPVSGLGLVEKMLIIILDLFVAALILISLVPIILVTYIIYDPVGAVFTNLDLFFQAILAVFKS